MHYSFKGSVCQEYDTKVELSSIMNENKRKILDPNLSPFQRLLLIMEILRSENGCAWDRKQTHKSLIPYLIEESYEVIEAIESGDQAELKEELGDLLCQVVFHAQLAKESGDFEVNDSINHISEKLIRRHPHVFENEKELSPDEVRNQWESIKINSGEKKSVLNGLPASMPGLLMAFRIGEKAAGVGFDWENEEDVISKLEEELLEIKEAISNKDKENLEEEIGDLLFAVGSLARKFEINPELALKKALNKFRVRFEKLELDVKKSGKRFDEYSLEELEAIWQKNK